MALNLTNFAPMLKTLYTKDKVQNLTFKENPLLADLPKAEDFYGESFTQPLIYGNPQGRSATFATAQGNKGNSKSAKFIVTRSKDYGLVSIDNETILASQNDAGAFVSARKAEIDGMFSEMANTLAVDLVGTGSGKRGQVSASQNVALTVVTLADAHDIVKIEVGMAFVLSAADGGGSVRSGKAWVISVDRKAGTFVVSNTQGGSATALSTCIAAAAASDFIFVEGDYDSKIKGLKSWLVYGGPSSGAFFGLDRTTDPQRMAGVYEDFSAAATVEEALIDGAKLMKRYGSSIDRVWISEDKMSDLIKSQGSKVQYVDVAQSAEIGMRGVRLQTGKGVVDVFSDRNIALTDCFMLQRNTWKLKTLGGCPMILNMDSLEALREATADAIEVRIGYYGQLVCSAPGYNGIFKI
jgi:hypothetical protein